MSLKDVYNANNLAMAFRKAKQGTDWKESVQKYEMNELLNIYNSREEIKNGVYNAKEMTEFTLCERGHTRKIIAQNIYGRVILRSLNDNVLIPKIRPKLIYDNGASLKDKGLSFARKRFEKHLRSAYKEYGYDCYILLMDFKKYYDNIQHKIALDMFGKYIDEDELKYVETVFHEFAVDVSYMSNEEYKDCINKLYNSLEAPQIPKRQRTGEKLMLKSLGIGNQISQITGILYPHEIDNFCKIVMGIKYYGRYMDDTYIIMKDKDELKRVYKKIQKKCDELGIFINRKKTHIHRINTWITWLKINYRLKPTGGLIRKVHSSTISRERRRLNKFRRLLYNNKMTYLDILECYKSWRGNYAKYDSGVKLHRLDKYFVKLFKEETKNDKSRNYAGNHQFKKRA